LKKRKPLSFKEFTLVKKSKFIFLYVNIFRKRKNEIEKKKADVFISHKLLSRKLKQNYMNDSVLWYLLNQLSSVSVSDSTGKKNTTLYNLFFLMNGKLIIFSLILIAVMYFPLTEVSGANSDMKFYVLNLKAYKYIYV
jgi:hypothetical protein